jgi:hypothetical protein
MENDYGVPTAPIVTSRFADYVQRDGRSHGMNLRWSFPPYPVGFIPKEILRSYVDGNDPVSGVPLMDEVIFALTAPLTEEEKNTKPAKRPHWPRLLEPDTEENLHRLFLESGWTDGLPIILPTEERVAEMLTGQCRHGGLPAGAFPRYPGLRRLRAAFPAQLDHFFCQHDGGQRPHP